MCVLGEDYISWTGCLSVSLREQRYQNSAVQQLRAEVGSPAAQGCCFSILNLGESIFSEEQMWLLVGCECCGSLVFAFSIHSISSGGLKYWENGWICSPLTWASPGGCLT